MKRFALVGISFVICSFLLPAAEKAPKKAQVEPLSQDRFSEIHAPLLQPAKTNEAGAITARVAASLPATGKSSTPVARRNFIDNHIFGKMQQDGVPHAALASDNEFLRRISKDHVNDRARLREFARDFGCLVAGYATRDAKYDALAFERAWRHVNPAADSLRGSTGGR